MHASDTVFYKALPTWDRLSSFALSNATCDLVCYRYDLLKARTAREGRPSSFTIYLDCLDAPSWGLAKDQLEVGWENLAVDAQLDQDEGLASSMEMVVWVETEEKKEELAKLAREGAERAVLKGIVSTRFEIRVEVHPSRAGTKDREDGWAGKTIESWR